MVPSTFVGLLVFVILLIPGFVFVRRSERTGPERQLSPLRETVAIIFVSVICDVIVVTAVMVVWELIPSGSIDVAQLLSTPNTYVRDHYMLLWVWILAALVTASLLALLTAGPLARLARRHTGDRSHEPFLSAWARLFTVHPECRVFLGCQMVDGSYIAGWLHTYSRAAVDSPDRELTLRGPLQYRPAGEIETTELTGVGTVSVSARQLAMLFVSYVRVEANNER